MKFIFMISTVLFSAGAFASDIGPAGCGLGNRIFHKENQVLAATTNGSTWNQAFGITSGTSGCEEGKGMAKLENFVDGNRQALANDAARGFGETVVSLSHLLHCEDAEEVGSVLTENYSSVFPSANATSADISMRVQNVLRRKNVSCIRAS